LELIKQMLFWFVISYDGIIGIRKSVWLKENSKYMKDMHEVMIQAILYCSCYTIFWGLMLN
jgi:hypothetical protein